VSAEKAFEVVGLGNALVDALVRMDERQLLNELGYTRGQMTPVSDDDWRAVQERIEGEGVEIQSGGSCANTIVALGWLGANSSYCGQVGRDELGELYSQRLLEACGTHALHWTEEYRTGKCLSIVGESDAERTMLTDLGAAIHLPGLGDFAAQIKQTKVLHLTAYLLLGEPMATRAREAIDIAREAGCLISLDVADPFVVGLTSELIWEIIENHADIVFLNQEEAKALCGDSNAEGFERLCSLARTVVLKLGAEGSEVHQDGIWHTVAAHQVDPVDTTGAGDSYAAGFLYGLVHGWPTAHSMDLGSRVAAMTVSQLGAVVRDRDRMLEAILLCQPEGPAKEPETKLHQRPL
jgi:sugar/nucleoside kinase (ribokinase family)